MSSKESSDITKILEKLFIFEDNSDLAINRSKSLIVNPEILRVLIYQLA
jgi:hypothetical protein